jgi:LCP family protein required for cell wall assembly
MSADLNATADGTPLPEERTGEEPAERTNERPAELIGEQPAGDRPTTGRPARRKGRWRSLRRWKKVAIILVGVLLVLAGGTAGAGWALVHRYESQVTHEDLLGDAAPPPAQQEQHFAAGPLNLLLLGSDSREGEVGKGSIPGARSDTVMLVHIAAKRDKATIISIPRDSYVNIPGGGDWKGGMNKLNAAFAFGGAPLAAKTVTQLTGVALDGAMIANFAGIRDMVDAVGGVNVCVPYDVKSYFSKTVWKTGCHDMGGAEAEEFMRNRMFVPGGDFGRMKDQQLVVQGVIQKVSSQGLLNNPLMLDRLLVAAAQSLTIDNSLNLRQLVTSVRDINPSAVTFTTAPFTRDDLKTPAGTAVELDAQKCAALFASVRDDTVDQWLQANPPPAGTN